MLAVVGLVIGCSPTENRRDTGTDGRFPVRVQLDWFPEPQHGGLYQALAKGYFEDEGLEVTLLSGGSNVLVTQFVATGQADIGQSASTQVMQAVAGGLPIKNIASVFHRLPSALLMHEDNPVSSFADLDGKTIMGRPEALYIPYLKQRYGINFTVIPQSFGMASFLQDKAFIQEGFFIAEPYYLEKAGAKVKWLPLWDSGYAPAATLFANDRFLENYPEVTRRFLRAYIRGWRDYLENDPDPAHALIRQGNPRVDDAFLAFSRDQIVAYALGKGDPDQDETYGSLSEERFAREIAILESIGALKPGAVTVDSVLDISFLPETK